VRFFFIVVRVVCERNFVLLELLREPVLLFEKRRTAGIIINNITLLL